MATQQPTKWSCAHASAPHRRPPRKQKALAYALREERGCQFEGGQAFYRAESAQARDLAVLAAAVYREETGHLHVLDAMCGCGLRAKRYLCQAGADSVWSNDLDSRNFDAIMANTKSALEVPEHTQVMHPHLRKPVTEVYAAPAPPSSAAAPHEPGPPVLRGLVSNLDGALPLSAQPFPPQIPTAETD
eukprot:jgi/Ulvmu1/2891/UM146_0033.1